MKNTARKQRSKRKPASGTRWKPKVAHSSTKTATRIAPDEFDVKLLYRTTSALENTVAPFAKKSWYPNAAYDVDPSVGSTETYGFDEYAALYSYYRVIGYSYQITVVNRSDISTVPIMAYVLNTNTDPSVSGTSYYLYSTNPHCQSRLISNVSPNMYVFRGHFTCAQIVGSDMVETADSFRSTTSGIPADLLWLTLGVEGIGTTFPTISATYDFKLTMHVRFFARNVDLTLSAMAARLNAAVAARERHQLTKRLISASASLPKGSAPTPN